ncbi:MAG: hypothetical protein LUO89_02370 [Methanothrix sp.]|nr:hypothetical protein [Methanothrix sp.]
MIVSGLLTSAFTYFYPVSMARLLEPAEYGTLYSLNSLLIIVSVLTQAVALTTARYSSKLKAQGNLDGVGVLWRSSLKRTLLVGLALFVLLAALSPLLAKLLKIDSTFHLVVVFASVIFAFSLWANFGFLQGLQRFYALASTQTLWAFLRPASGIFLVVLGFGLLGGLVALPISFAVVLIVSSLLLSHSSGSGTATARADTSGIVSYVSFTLVATLSLTALINLDVLLAKAFLNDQGAASYSLISVLGKVAVYAPTGIAAAMFPKTSESFERGSEHRAVFLRAMFLCVAAVAAVCLAFALFPTQIIHLLSQGKYDDAAISPYLPRYALAMSFLALSSVVVTYFLSIAKTRVAYCLLGSVALQVALFGLYHSDIGQMVNVVLISGAVTLAALLLIFVVWSGTRKKHQDESGEMSNMSLHNPL